VNTDFDKLVSIVESASDDFDFMPFFSKIFFPGTPYEFDGLVREVAEVKKSVAYHKTPVNGETGDKVVLRGLTSIY